MAVISWLIWKSRNEKVFQGIEWRASDDDLLKLNVDGAFSDKGAGVGIVVSYGTD